MEIAAAYDEWSHSYETNENRTRDLAAKVLRQQYPTLAHRDVLEIGCGTGLNTQHLVAVSSRVLAVDFSPGMLERARANLDATNIEFAQLDLQQEWQIATSLFDLVVCTLVLEHIADLEHVFRETARVLRASGEFFFCELHPFRQLLGRQAQFTDEKGGVVRVTAYLHNLSEYVNTSVSQGFEIIRLDEWHDEGSESSPRLLSLRLRKRE
ncbi:MAG TPA: methyltransferase domain-containing protein [Pyrinomonadaceae bacterium]|nr:methyltransferase domain-containing protein [Pyrinomonadaceae bacterium]